MNEASVRVELENPQPVYFPGDRITATYQVADEPTDELRGFEVSVAWYTTGKGDEDLGVHYFEKVDEYGARALDPRQVRRLSTPLPASPLTYDGIAIKLHWCVRVRAVFAKEAAWIGEAPFRLGEVAAAQEVPKE